MEQSTEPEPSAEELRARMRAVLAEMRRTMQLPDPAPDVRPAAAAPRRKLARKPRATG